MADSPNLVNEKAFIKFRDMAKTTNIPNFIKIDPLVESTEQATNRHHSPKLLFGLIEH